MEDRVRSAPAARSAYALAALVATVSMGHAWLLDRVAASLVRAVPAAVSAAVVVVQAAPARAAAPAVVEAPRIESPVPREPVVREPAAPKPAAPKRRPAAAVPAGPVQAAALPQAEAPPPSPALAEHEAGPASAPEPVGPWLIAAGASAPAAVAPVPTYRTRMPPALRVAYSISQGLLGGDGQLDWQPEGGGYSLRLEAKLPVIGPLITQTSRGAFDAAGIAPLRHTDKRINRPERAASFVREQGVVMFSNNAASVPLVPGMQDRLSVMVQLGAVAAAGPQPPAVGAAVQLRVIGVGGDSGVWVMRFEGVQAVETPAGPVNAWHYLREADTPKDTRAEYWLDPALHHLPLRVRLTDGNSKPLELMRRASP